MRKKKRKREKKFRYFLSVTILLGETGVVGGVGYFVFFLSLFCDIKMTQPTVGLPPPYPDFEGEEEEKEDTFGYELTDFGKAASVLCKSSLFLFAMF